MSIPAVYVKSLAQWVLNVVKQQLDHTLLINKLVYKL